MQQLGMIEREISGVLKIVAAVLRMDNVDFEQVPHKREDNVFVDEARIMTSTAEECNHLKKKAQVSNKRQRQATGLLDTEDENEISTDFIYLLDIFGFEDMIENSFEQLCIKYASKALQHQFNRYIFEEKQRLYRDEAI
ncbi:hypothetical protein PsorP6_010747 [Peronosclerospora sorghi]|uniref:Uncharacterized protein n=1 Tax=Peronosclerospora sorghi TaxID=230839 RepID=A0ACC0VTZ6_9STRA|nr:hypothetical protein PsorP6_010747 [Peronosclerospora sorghi]